MPGSWPKGRYLTFSNSVVLPPITVLNGTAIQVGQWEPMELGRESGKPKIEKKIVAMQLGIPVGVVDRVLERHARNPQMQALDVAQELRAATIQFRFLLAEITCYGPPPEGQQAKTEVLRAMLNGDLPKAWQLYVAFPWPAPHAAPTGLHVAAAN